MQTWLEELEASVTDALELEKYIKLTKEEKKALFYKNKKFKITPHILKMIKYNDKSGRIRRQFIPSNYKLPLLSGFKNDYMCEMDNEVCENLIIRYPYKAILLVTQKCPAYCQFCTRKRMLCEDSHQMNLNTAFKFLEDHHEIFDVVITGGDPLIIDDFELENIFCRLNKIKSIKFIRINTRIPVTLPKRINKSLIELLQKYNVNYMNIHFEHPDEISDETTEACLKLANNGILLGSQSVLLNQINNDKEILILIPKNHIDKIHALPVMLIMVSGERFWMIRQSLSTT